jgi:signal peptidase I
LVISNAVWTTLRRAILVWLVSLISVGLSVACTYFVIIPYIFAAFIVPTNPMAPTVVGWHHESVCPHCQGMLIVPAHPPEEQLRYSSRDEQLCICSSCLKTITLRPGELPLQSPDRIVVNKLLTPRRWDIIAFRHPKDPSLKYLMRLVGLPGETVYIKEGEIWVNEVKTEFPAELTALRYHPRADNYSHPLWAPNANNSLPPLGTPEDPWRLGPDEYWVLGDFSPRSADSRIWGPVPGANIEGVLSVRYWPPSRWEVFR